MIARFWRSGLAWILALVFLAAPAGAEVELFGGPTFNTYAIDWEELEALVGPVSEYLDFDSGYGAYAGLQYWLNESIALGGQIDYFTGFSEYQPAPSGKASLHATGLGYLGRVSANLPVSDRSRLRPFVAFGSYSLNADLDLEQTSGPVTGSTTAAIAAEPRFGAILGATLDFPLSDRLTLGGTAGYRAISEFSDITAELSSYELRMTGVEGLDLSGWTAGLELSYRF